MSAAGVDEEVAGEVAVGEAGGDDPSPGGVEFEAGDVGVAEDRDVGQRGEPRAHGPFEEWAGHRRAEQGRRGAAGNAAALVPVHVGGEVDLHRTAGVELIDDPGKPAFEESSAACQEEVGVAALGHLAAPRRGVGKSVAVDDGDLVEAVGQHAAAEPGHAGADHDGVLADPGRRGGSVGGHHQIAFLRDEYGVAGIAGSVVHDNVVEPGVGQHATGDLFAPGGAETGAADGE